MYKSKKTNRCLTFSVYIHTVHTTYFSHYIDLDKIFGHGISNSGRLGQIFLILRTTLFNAYLRKHNKVVCLKQRCESGKTRLLFRLEFDFMEILLKYVYKYLAPAPTSFCLIRFPSIC